MVRPDNTDDQRCIGARGNMCLLHVSESGITLALQVCGIVFFQQLFHIGSLLRCSSAMAPCPSRLLWLQPPPCPTLQHPSMLFVAPAVLAAASMPSVSHFRLPYAQYAHLSLIFLSSSVMHTASISFLLSSLCLPLLWYPFKPPPISGFMSVLITSPVFLILMFHFCDASK